VQLYLGIRSVLMVAWLGLGGTVPSLRLKRFDTSSWLAMARCESGKPKCRDGWDVECGGRG
jgi:hypothetical protein